MFAGFEKRTEVCEPGEEWTIKREVGDDTDLVAKDK